MYPEALLCGSERFYGLGHPSGLRLYILFGPKILFHLRARSIWTHSRLDSDQKGVTRESKASSAKIAPKSIKIQSYYPKSSIFNLFGNVLGGFWATLCTFQGHLDRLDVFFGPTNAFKHIKFENIRNLTLITDLKVPSLKGCVRDLRKVSDLEFSEFSRFSRMRLRRSRATQRELRDATSRGWGLDMIKTEKTKTFLKNFFFRWKFSFFKNRKSKIFEKVTFFSFTFFDFNKYIFWQFFFSKKNL